MTDLWSQASTERDWWNLLDQFSDEALRRIATAVLGVVPRLIHPSFDALYGPEYVEGFNAVLAAASNDASDQWEYLELSARMMDLDDGERGSTPGAGSLSAAVLEFLEALTRHFDRNRTLEVLNQSYEAVRLATSRRGEDTEYSTAMVEFQREVIARES